MRSSLKKDLRSSLKKDLFWTWGVVRDSGSLGDFAAFGKKTNAFGGSPFGPVLPVLGVLECAPTNRAVFLAFCFIFQPPRGASAGLLLQWDASSGKWGFEYALP